MLLGTLPVGSVVILNTILFQCSATHSGWSIRSPILTSSSSLGIVTFPFVTFPFVTFPFVTFPFVTFPFVGGGGGSAPCPLLPPFVFPLFSKVALTCLDLFWVHSKASFDFLALQGCY